jgi:hypothetical protein
MHESLLVIPKADGKVAKDTQALARTAVRRRRSLRYSLPFEAIACGRGGAKIHGTAYRQGSKHNGVTACYQFRVTEADGEADRGDETRHEPPVCAVVRRRLRVLLDHHDVDLLYLRYGAGWSQAAVAQHLGCCRSTVKRREERILRQLLEDPALRQAAAR